MATMYQPQARPTDHALEPRPPAPPIPRFLNLQRRFALAQHQHYLTALLATYRGPYGETWAAELARVNAQLAEVDN